jgi:hypothetical protein
MPMPVYYFDIDDSGRDIPDTEGTELGDLTQARTEALRMLGEVAKNELPKSDRTRFAIAICSESGKPLLTVSLSVRAAQAA